MRIIGAAGADSTQSFAELRQRSNQVANFLRGLGVCRGDRVLVMLGNQVELWETLLATMKPGAVMMPAPALLASSDLADRVRRGNARHVVVGSEHTEKFEAVAGDFPRIAVGERVSGWNAYAESQPLRRARRTAGWRRRLRSSCC